MLSAQACLAARTLIGCSEGTLLIAPQKWAKIEAVTIDPEKREATLVCQEKAHVISLDVDVIDPKGGGETTQVGEYFVRPKFDPHGQFYNPYRDWDDD